MNKIIHQTWKTRGYPRDRYKPVWQQSWKDQHPDWEYKFWTDEDNEQLVREHYPQFLTAYQQLSRGVMKSDIARVLYLHQLGGMYADLDFVCLRSMDGLLSALGDYIVVGQHSQCAQPLPNAWMYSPPEQPFWLRYVEDALGDWRRGQRKVEQIAGPDRLQWALDKYKPWHVQLPPPVVYPFAWGNHEQTLRAGRLNWESLDELREAYPSSMAATCWAHGW